MTNKLELTELESKVLNELISGLYAEPGFSDVSPSDLSEGTGIKMNVLRGVLGSLSKKDVINVEDKKYLGSSDDIVYLNSSHWHLHPQWKTEVE
jgi:ribosomal protein S25